MTVAQKYNWRKAPLLFSGGWFDTEHQHIQQALADIASSVQADLHVLTLPKSVNRTGVQDATQAIVDTLGLATLTANGATVSLGPGTLLCGDIVMPGDNITVMGAGSGYSYGSTASVRTSLKAKPGTTNVFSLVATGGVVDRAGCVLKDFQIDGNLTAANGVKISNGNILKRLRVRGCLSYGGLLADFTNTSLIDECGFIDNFGWGLGAQGSGTTAYWIDKSKINLNGLGGFDMQAGVVVSIARTILESSAGPALRIYRPDGTLVGGITVQDSWLEDNGSTAPNFTIVIDAQTRSLATAPWKIHFKNCRHNTGGITRKHMSIMCANGVTFEEDNFDSSTASDTITLGAEARYVAFLESAEASPSFAGLSATQLDNAIAQGTRCYSSDRNIKRVVGAGAPAAAFSNAWVNAGGAAQTAQYWFDREGRVCLEGTISTGTIGLSAFTLPVGYRPAAPQRFGVPSNGAFGELLVNTDGTVVPNVGSNVSFNLNGVCFPTG